MTREKREKILNLLPYKDIRRIQWSTSTYAYIEYCIDGSNHHYAKLTNLKSTKKIPENDNVVLMLTSIIQDIVDDQLFDDPPKNHKGR